MTEFNIDTLINEIRMLTQRATTQVGKLSGGREFVIDGKGEIVVYPYCDNPEPEMLRIKQVVSFVDLRSFVAYVQRYKHHGTRIFGVPSFASPTRKARITAAFDYHDAAETLFDADAGPDDGGIERLPGKPKRCEHFAIYDPRYSVEWDLWSQERTLGQSDFAEFIEENRRDIRQPDAARLLDIVRTFKMSRKQEFDSVVYAQDGSVKLSYTDEANAAGQSSAMPEKLQLGIPVFFRGELFQVDTFVRYRLSSGKVHFTLVPDRLDLIEDVAFEGIIEKIKAETEIDPYIGHIA